MRTLLRFRRLSNKLPVSGPSIPRTPDGPKIAPYLPVIAGILGVIKAILEFYKK